MQLTSIIAGLAGHAAHKVYGRGRSHVMFLPLKREPAGRRADCPRPLMRASQVVSVLIGLSAVLGCPRVSAAQGDLNPVLATLEGSWEGEGELLGRPATFVRHSNAR